MTETLGSQAQQTGNNTVVVSDDLATLGTQVGDKYTTYTNRAILIDRTGTPQLREVISQAAGTGNTIILTVDRDWDTNPIETTHDIDVFYDVDDIETGISGTSGNGISLSARTGLYELSNVLTVQANAGLHNSYGQALEADDRGSNVAIIVASTGWFVSGYPAGDASINGAIYTSYNGSAAEPSWQFQSGSVGRFYDSLFWAQLVTQQFECVAGSDVRFDGCKLLKNTEELHLYDAELVNSGIGGLAATTEIVRVNAGTIANGLSLADIDTLDTVADTAAETIELEGVVFSGVTDLWNIRQNKTINMIDPIWDATVYTDFTWVGTTTGNVLNDRRSIKVTVQTSDGTKLSDALVNVYENTQSDDLVLELVTAAVTGFVEDSFIYLAHATNSSTTTYGGHALQSNKWLYLPFVAAQVSDEKFNGVIVLNPDNNIVQTTQSTAIAVGSSVTWNDDTNPSELFNFTLGSGTLAVGMILTFTSGATGTITEALDGDSVAGIIHLKDRNATAITNGDTFSRTGGTAGTFSGTYTNDSKQPFSIWIDAATITYQALYDYIAAITTETTLGATGELVWEWCRSAQTQAFYSTGSTFLTERSNGKGIMIVNSGGGTLDYVTDDAGAQWSPPAVITIRVEGVSEGAAVVVIADETVGSMTEGDIIFEKFADSDGVAEVTNFKYESAFNPSGLDVVVRARSSGNAIAVLQDDNGSFTDETTEANSSTTDDMLLLPTVPVVNEDRYLFGHTEKFSQLKLNVSVVGTGGFTMTWQYWNGAWTNLSGVSDGTSSFSVLGENIVSWTMPGDWATTTINGQGPFYYVRAAYTAGSVTIVPKGKKCTLDVTKYLPFAQDRIVISTGLGVVATWIEDAIASF